MECSSSPTSKLVVLARDFVEYSVSLLVVAMQSRGAAIT